LMGTGVGRGEHRAMDAAQKAIASPLLEETSIDGARGILVNITGGPELTLHEVNEAASKVAETADPDANIIVGAGGDPTLTDEVRVTVIATGFEDRRVGAMPVAQAAAAAGPTLGAVPPPTGRTVDLKSYRGGERSSPWRRPRVDGVRADGLDQGPD